MTSKERVEHYKMLYRVYHWLSKVEDECLKFPGELSASEIQDISRLKNSFALGLFNTENHSLTITESIRAKKELQKEYKV